MNWAVAATLAGLAMGLAAGLLVAYRLWSLRSRGTTPAGEAAPGRGRLSASGMPAITGARMRGRRHRMVEDERLALAAVGRRAIDSLRAGVVVLDDDDVPVLVNPAARAMGLLRTGTTPGSVAAHPLLATLAGQVRRTGVRRELELDLPGGRARVGPDPLGVHLRAMGLGAGLVAVEAADVTEAHRLARVRRDFVANVSHELKTPVGALQLLAEALLDATGSGDEADGEAVADVTAVRRFAERISNESTRLGRLIHELLELSRLQGAEPQPPAAPVPVDWVISEAIDRTRTTATARATEIIVFGKRDLSVHGVADQVATAVTNLLDNAINYSGEGAMVTVTTTVAQGYVRIEVSDQGIGIAPDDLDRIFERFYRADQARSRATGGTGLGLAIVKHIASNHGGRVEVASTLGVGSTFTLLLPTPPAQELPASSPGGDGAGEAPLSAPGGSALRKGER